MENPEKSDFSKISWEKLEIFHERLWACHSCAHRDLSFPLQDPDLWNPPSYLEKWFWIPFSFLQVSDFLFWRAWFHRNSCSKIVYLETVENKNQTIFQFNTLDMVCFDSEVILLYISECRRRMSSKIMIFQLFRVKKYCQKSQHEVNIHSRGMSMISHAELEASMVHHYH